MTIDVNMTQNCNKCPIHFESGTNKTRTNKTKELKFQIILFDNKDKSIEISISNKANLSDLFKIVCDKLQLKQFDMDMFDLARKTDTKEYEFLPHTLKLSKLSQLLPKRNDSFESKSSSIAFKLGSITDLCPRNTFALKILNNLNNNLFSNSNKTSQNNKIANKSCSCNTEEEVEELSDENLKLYFRVKFYVPDPLQLRDSLTRNMYYLQLRQNYLRINHRLSDEKYFLLCSLALYVDLGPYDLNKHTKNYFELCSYFPKFVIKKLGEHFIYENMPRLHEETSRRYTTQEKAQIRFCAELSNEEYPFNIHLYNLHKHKEEIHTNNQEEISMGISPKGLLIFEKRSTNEISLISTFSWPCVIKINSEVKF
jgi:hypothetical protein